ncbi:hypothetical protein ACQ86N_16410 [Puia sp. P3]
MQHEAVAEVEDVVLYNGGLGAYGGDLYRIDADGQVAEGKNILSCR